jgi:hypothetical protein
MPQTKALRRSSSSTAACPDCGPRCHHVAGAVYLIHFDHPFKHARHYLGWASDLPARLQAHRGGTGGRLLRAVNNAGITWEVVRTWADKDLFLSVN